jgi:hypothetical protein
MPLSALTAPQKGERHASERFFLVTSAVKGKNRKSPTCDQNDANDPGRVKTPETAIVTQQTKAKSVLYESFVQE